jgi:cobyrinic acid a,c-diamide synthase
MTTAPGLVIAAPASGAGKTTVALALMAACVRRGLVVQPFKVGPDFLDPGHASLVAGRPARTLDGWMLGRAPSLASFADATRDADVAVVEGMMGLFDGLAATSDAGSTAEIAKWLGLPVLLVVDAGAMARSAAALVGGFRDFDPALAVAGVVFNRVGGTGHLAILRAALAASAGPPCLGGMPLDPALSIPERHLGLVTAGERPPAFAALADAAERHLDVDAIVTMARPARAAPGDGVGDGDARARVPADVRARAARGRREVVAARRGGEVAIAVARDEAFSFYYPENLERLVDAGAALVEFSPLRDPSLPAGVSGVILGGGYPELHAARLAANAALLADLRRFAAAGGLVYAECGGLMLLGTTLADAAGARFAMAGVLPFATRMLAHGMTLGYREVAIAASPVLPALRARGHEFHHSTLDAASVPPALARCYEVRDPGTGAVAREGFTRGRTLASYVHLHFASAPALAPALVAAARRAVADLPRPPQPGRAAPAGA